MKTLIRLLLEEQSDLGLHCLPRPVCPKTLELYGKCSNKCRRSFLKKVQTHTAHLASENFLSPKCLGMCANILPEKEIRCVFDEI